jgi:hypothetical protein
MRMERRSLLPGVGTLVSAQQFVFQYDAPRIVYVYPTRLPDEGGVLTIIGFSFGTHGTFKFVQYEVYVFLSLGAAETDTCYDAVFAANATALS